MAPTSGEKKASRITTACNPCRSRKQKCSGKRPTCEQCLEYKRPCAWPEQLKRGPAKGYIEDLEHRLHETENVLLNIISQLSNDQLSSILSEDIASPTENQDATFMYTPPPFLRKKGGEYWKAFPLDSTKNIRRWEQDCINHTRSAFGSVEAGTRPTASPLSTSCEEHLDTRGSASGGNSFEDNSNFSEPNLAMDDSQMEVCSGPSEKVVSPASEGTITPSRPNPSHLKRWPGQADKPHSMFTGAETAGDCSSFDTVTQSQPGDFTQALTPSAPPEPSSWTAAPPIKFQQRFLW